MRTLTTAILTASLGLALTGCTGVAAPEPRPTPVAVKEHPAEEQRQEEVRVCAQATAINTIVNDADWSYTQHSIPAEVWLATLLDAKEQAYRLADQNADEPYALAVKEYSAMVNAFNEAPPLDLPARDWEHAATFTAMCEDASAGYGVGGGGAVGG